MFSLTTVVSTLLCFSSIVSALPKELASRQQQCRHQSFPVNGKLYTLTCDVDRPGGDYAALQPLTLPYCLNACDADPRCASATWVPSTQFCYLKNVTTYESLSTGLATLVVGTGCQNRQRVVGGRQCTVACGTDFVGNNYRQQYYGSFEACVQACGADSQCASAQYREDTGFCYFKNTQQLAGVSRSSNSLVDTISCGNGTGHA